LTVSIILKHSKSSIACCWILASIKIGRFTAAFMPANDFIPVACWLFWWQITQSSTPQLLNEQNVISSTNINSSFVGEDRIHNLILSWQKKLAYNQPKDQPFLFTALGCWAIGRNCNCKLFCQLWIMILWIMIEYFMKLEYSDLLKGKW